MKKNCQLYTAKELWDEIFNYEKFFPKDVRIDDSGSLVWTRPDGQRASILAINCAYRINMPLWEVVMVDNQGDDEYALLFFE